MNTSADNFGHNSLRQKIIGIFDVLWLPVFLLAATTWLYAPVLHQGHLMTISSYEGMGAPFAWLFRSGDIVAAVLVVLVIARKRLQRTQPVMSYMLLGAAALMVLDDVCVVGCVQQCSTWALWSIQIHDVESVISAIVFAGAVGFDALRNKRAVSQIFLGIQAMIGALAISTLIDHQGMMRVQFVYQALLMCWVAYFLWSSQRRAGRNWSKLSGIRLLFSSLVFVSGLLELVSALHTHAYGNWPNIVAHEPSWLAQHSVVAGVAMLYLARHIYRGQRRAALLLAIVLAGQIYRYSVLTPNGYMLALGQILTLILLVGWPLFNRNNTVPPLVWRLKNLAVVFAGVVAACLVLFGVAMASGRTRVLIHDIQHVAQTSSHVSQPLVHRQELIEHRLRHLRVVASDLALSLMALSLWTIFRPADGAQQEAKLTRQQVKCYLDKFSRSSEDYFKLWPLDKRYFTSRQYKGFIAYKKISSTVFALADPICMPADRQVFLAEFVQFCRSHGWSVCFLLVADGSREMYAKAGLKTMHIGSSAIVPVRPFVDVTLRDKWWRWQTNRATKTGLQYQKLSPPHDASLLTELAQVSADWLDRQGHREQGFALGYYDETYMQQCIIHVLRNDEGALVAFANQLPIYNDLRQATIDLMRFKPDAKGAMPRLLSGVIASLASEGAYDTFDLGFVPMAKVESPIATIAARLGAGRFSMSGLEQFKDKFDPVWAAQYLAYDGDIVDLTVLLARLERALSID